jgi:hypothetical protein
MILIPNLLGGLFGFIPEETSAMAQNSEELFQQPSD